MIAVFSGFWAKGNNINLESRNFQPFLSVFVRTMATACDTAGRSKVSLTLSELPNTIFHQCHHLLPLAATPMSVSLRGRRRWIGSSEISIVIPSHSNLVLSRPVDYCCQFIPTAHRPSQCSCTCSDASHQRLPWVRADDPKADRIVVTARWRHSVRRSHGRYQIIPPAIKSLEEMPH